MDEVNQGKHHIPVEHLRDVVRWRWCLCLGRRYHFSLSRGPSVETNHQRGRPAMESRDAQWSGKRGPDEFPLSSDGRREQTHPPRHFPRARLSVTPGNTSASDQSYLLPLPRDVTSFPCPNMSAFSFPDFRVCFSSLRAFQKRVSSFPSQLSNALGNR